MKIVTIKCDNCEKVVELSAGDRWSVQFKIGQRYVVAWITLTENHHLCEDCWPKIIEGSPEQ